jgi:hypothetical protein
MLSLACSNDGTRLVVTHLLTLMRSVSSSRSSTVSGGVRAVQPASEMIWRTSAARPSWEFDPVDLPSVVNRQQVRDVESSTRRIAVTATRLPLKGDRFRGNLQLSKSRLE